MYRSELDSTVCAFGRVFGGVCINDWKQRCLFVWACFSFCWWMWKTGVCVCVCLKHWLPQWAISSCSLNWQTQSKRVCWLTIRGPLSSNQPSLSCLVFLRDSWQLQSNMLGLQVWQSSALDTKVKSRQTNGRGVNKSDSAVCVSSELLSSTKTNL